MTKLRNTFEGGTNNTAITTGNSAAGSGDAFLAVAAVNFDNTHVMHGTMAAKITATGTGNGNIRWGISDRYCVFRSYFYIDQLPGADYWLARITQAGDAVNAAIVYITSTGFLRLYSAGSVTQWTAAAQFPVGQMVRVELWVDGGTTASDGQLQIKYFLGDSPTPIEDSGLKSGISVGGGNGALSMFRLGKNNSTSPANQLWFDDPELWTGTTDAGTSPTFIGPAAAGALSGVATVNSGMAELIATPSGGTAPYTFGNPVQTGGTSTPAVNVDPGIWLVKQHTVDTLTYTVTITDAVAATKTLTFTVPPVPTTTPAVWPKRPTGTGASGTTWT